MISKLIVIGLAEVYISFLECGKVVGMQKMNIGLQRMGLCSQFNSPGLKIYGEYAWCLVLGAVACKTQLLSQGSYRLVEGTGDLNLNSRTWRAL